MTKTVNDYVLEQLERLSNSKLKGEELKNELEKAEAVSKLAKVSIEDKEADIKSKELDVKKDLIAHQYGNRPTVPALPGALANEEV